MPKSKAQTIGGTDQMR